MSDQHDTTQPLQDSDIAAAVADISLVVERALLRILQHAHAHPGMGGMTGPTGPSGPAGGPHPLRRVS